MKQPSDIESIANDRLEDAECLLGGGRFSGAMYLAGYNFELLLKAKICQHLDIANLFDEEFAKSINKGVMGLEFTFGIEFRKFFLVHDLAKLFLLTGLRSKFDLDKANDRSGKLMGA